MSAALPVLQGRLVRLRPVRDEDIPRLLAILVEPDVAAWWRRAEWEEIDEPGSLSFTVEVGGEIAGFIQANEEIAHDYYSSSVDLFVGSAHRGRGVGPDAMRTIIAWLVDERGHHRVTVDPAAVNARAIHVYEKLGFKPVGVLRRYERIADGTWRDALLMELLAEEFVRD